MSNVLIKQHQLHKQAESVLKNLQLLSFLSTYGEVHTVGSFVTGLMTWPDIDIEVTHATLTLDNQLALAKFLFGKRAGQTSLPPGLPS